MKIQERKEIQGDKATVAWGFVPNRNKMIELNFSQPHRASGTKLESRITKSGNPGKSFCALGMNPGSLHSRSKGELNINQPLPSLQALQPQSSVWPINFCLEIELR